MLFRTAHIEYDNDDGKYSEISDMDKEQSQARYDPRLLSEDVSGYHSQSGDIGASSCYNANVRYLHGQKVISLKCEWKCRNFLVESRVERVEE